jgi:hypothetical protein
MIVFILLLVFFVFYVTVTDNLLDKDNHVFILLLVFFVFYVGRLTSRNLQVKMLLEG